MNQFAFDTFTFSLLAFKTLANLIIKIVLIKFRPEEKIRQLEKKVNELIEESCHSNEAGDLELVSL